MSSMLPSPNCSFTLPSINDSLELNCRLYFPKRELIDSNDLIAGFAIIAHPYAPLGGCYDDPTVHTVGSTLLRDKFVLCTFNFRGASGSHGRTSWSGKPELVDYVSIYVFMLRLIAYPNLIDNVSLVDGKPLLILGGYSYGSMIASHLPDLASVQSLHETMRTDGSDTEFEFRALEVGEVLVAGLRGPATTAGAEPRAGKERSSSSVSKEVVIGGSDLTDINQRASRKSPRRSFGADGIRHSYDRMKHKLTHHGSHHVDIASNGRGSGQSLASNNHTAKLIEPTIAYLLISPLLHPIAGFTTAFSKLTFEPRITTEALTAPKTMEQNLAENPTLVVYGDQDIFTSAKRLGKWIDHFQAMPGTRFTSEKVTGAGHFWHEEEWRAQLRRAIRWWVTEISDASISRHEVI